MSSLKLIISLLSVLIVPLLSNVNQNGFVEGTGPQVVMSKTWYEYLNYANNRWILRHFTFTFDQPLYIKDSDGSPVSVADPKLYYKLQNGQTKARVLCQDHSHLGLYMDNFIYEPEIITPAHYGKEQWYDYNTYISFGGVLNLGCAPYFFRAFDGNFILTDTNLPLSDLFVTHGGVGPSFQATYIGPDGARLPDFDSPGIHPGVKANEQGYNQTQLYLDLLNYKTDIPLELIDETTLTMTDVYYVEDTMSSYQGMYPWSYAFNSRLALNELWSVSPYWIGYDIPNQVDYKLLVSTLEDDTIPIQSRLSTYDALFDYYVDSSKRQKIMNINGEEAIGGADANLNWDFGKCTLSDLTELNKKYAELQSEMLKSQDPKALGTLQITLQTLERQFPYDTCFQYIKSLYSTTTTQVSLASSTECTNKFGTMQYAVDPCCNVTLSFTQCCAPKQVSTTIVQATALTNGSQCHNPDYALGAVKTLVSELNLDSQNAPVSELATDTFYRLTAFQGECYSVLFNTTCSSDVQCSYDSTCDVSQQLCIPSYNKLAESTLACYTDHMDSDLKNRLVAELQVQLDVSGQPIASDFINKFSSAVVRTDCVGPTASNYRTRYQTDSNGNIQYDQQGAPILIVGSQQSCLADQQCPYTPALGESCVPSKYLGSNFCGLCNDKTCVDITRPNQCVVTAFTTQTTCMAAGLYWKPITKQMTFSKYFSGQNGICIDLSAQTESDCLSTSICPKSNILGDNLSRCAQQFCYAPNIKDFKSCSKLNNQYSWIQSYASGSGLCVYGFDNELDDSDDDFSGKLKPGVTGWKNYVKSFLQRKNDQNGCDKGTVQFTGRVFIPGKFNTQQSCSVGQCSIRNDNLQYSFETETLSADKCSALSQCSTTCPKCRSAFSIDSNPASEIVCYDTKSASLNARQCFKEGGVWTRLAKNNYICRYQLDKQTCLSENHLVADCSGMTTDTCYSGNSPLDQLLQCTWSTTSQCSASECTSKGKCNDDEFINTPAGLGKNGAFSTGACIVPSPFVNGVPQLCSNIPSVNNSTINKYQVASKIAGQCLDFTIDQPTCDKLGYQYQGVAMSQLQCSSHGSNCFEIDGSFTAKRSTQCQQCGGKSISAYRWTPATIQSGYIRKNTIWQSRSTVSINSWKPTVVFPLLDQLIKKVTMRKIAIQQVSAISLRMSSILSTINTLACDCTSPFAPLLNEPDAFIYDNVQSLQTGDLVCYQKQVIQQSIGDLVPGSTLQLFTTQSNVFIDLSKYTGNGQSTYNTL